MSYYCYKSFIYFVFILVLLFFLLFSYGFCCYYVRLIPIANDKDSIGIRRTVFILFLDFAA